MSTPKKLQQKTVQKFIDYLEDLGLSVYGPCMSKDGCEYPSHMDYDAEKIVTRRKLMDADAIFSSEDFQ